MPHPTPNQLPKLSSSQSMCQSRQTRSRVETWLAKHWHNGTICPYTQGQDSQIPLSQHFSQPNQRREASSRLHTPCTRVQYPLQSAASSSMFLTVPGARREAIHSLASPGCRPCLYTLLASFSSRNSIWGRSCRLGIIACIASPITRTRGCPRSGTAGDRIFCRQSAGGRVLARPWKQ